MSKPDDKQGEEIRKDFFHHGVVSKLFTNNNMGVIRGESGREIPFSFQFVILVGDISSPNDLKEGQKVGYDLGWTPSGLRVTKIKTYPDPPAGDDSSDLEGEGSQG